MNSIIKSLKNYINNLSKQSKLDNAARIKMVAKREAERALQVREFQGELFLSYNNRPILPLVAILGGDSGDATKAISTLQISREVYTRYLMDNELKR